MELDLTQVSEDARVAAISVREQLFRVGYTSLPAYAILYFDYLLTLEDEVRFVWPARQWTLVVIVFYLNRYISLLGHIPILLGRYLLALSSNKDKACRNLLKYHQYLAGLIQVTAGVALTCRTYALYGRKRRTLYPLGIIGLAIIGFGFWAIHGMASLPMDHLEQFTPTGCLLPLSVEDANHYAGAWSGMLLFDVIIFVMTIYKSTTRWREDEFYQDATLLRVLLRDGSIYFGVMVMLTLSVIVSFYVSPEYERGLTTSLTNVLSSVMISRLMMNLRDPHITTNRKFRPHMLTTIMETSVSEDSLSECISNTEVVLQQAGGTASQVTLLSPNLRCRTPSDATDTTVVQYLGPGGVEGERRTEDANKYQRKMLESF